MLIHQKLRQIQMDPACEFVYLLIICRLLHRYQLHVSALMAIFRLIDWQQTCKQLYFGMRLVYGGWGLGLDGGTRSRVCWVGRVMWVHGYYCAVYGYYCAVYGYYLRCMGTIVPATCKQLYFGMRLVYGGGWLGLDGGTRSCVCWVGRVMWVHGYCCALHHTQDACQSIAAYKFVVNLSTWRWP